MALKKTILRVIVGQVGLSQDLREEKPAKWTWVGESIAGKGHGTNRGPEKTLLGKLQAQKSHHWLKCDNWGWTWGACEFGGIEPSRPW